MKVIFQALDKLFIAAKCKIIPLNANSFPVVFRHFQKEVFSQSDLTGLPNAFVALYLNYFNDLYGFAKHSLGVPKYF